MFRAAPSGSYGISYENTDGKLAEHALRLEMPRSFCAITAKGSVATLKTVTGTPREELGGELQHIRHKGQLEDLEAIKALKARYGYYL
jgi:hypothetical protein